MGEQPAKADIKARSSTRWRPGESGNPAGTKRGSKHRATLFAQALLDGDYWFGRIRASTGFASNLSKGFTRGCSISLVMNFWNTSPC
jgi:hypothetical protein